MPDNQVFDVSRKIDLTILSAEGPKRVTVRFPTDDEWIERQRRRKVTIKQLGRGISETTVGHTEEVDAALVAKIRVDETGPSVDPFEASRVIEQLSQVDVDDVAAEPGGFRITTRVPGGVTTHHLRMPSARDVIEYRRGFARVLDLPYNRQELTINLGAAGSLYQKLIEATEGYAGAVPVIHQAVAVKAAIDAVESGFEEKSSVNF